MSDQEKNEFNKYKYENIIATAIENIANGGTIESVPLVIRKRILYYYSRIMIPG